MSRSNRTLLELYELMMLTRTLDKVLGKHDGHWHGLEGEEATIAGVYHGLRKSDVVAPHYRGAVSAALAKGADLRTIMAGCLGRSTSYHAGRHRSDICGPPEFGLIGLYAGSLGPPLGYAAGGALASKLDGRDDVAVGVFGDGTSSRGDCHEAMNMAAVLTLPMVFVCQNNQIAISTELNAGVGGRIVDRGPATGMPGVRVDGNDVLAVKEAMDEAVGRARVGGGPTLIECESYRVAGHFYSDAEDYRDPQEIERWRKKDPVDSYRRKLIEQGVETAELLEQTDARILEDVQNAFDEALQDPVPDPRTLDPGSVYAEVAQ